MDRFCRRLRRASGPQKRIPPAGRLRVAYLILGIEEGCSDELESSHIMALRSIQRAVSKSPPNLDITLMVGVTGEGFDYSQFDVMPVFFPNNARSIFGRRVPPLALVADVFSYLGQVDADVVVVTNADICLFGDFFSKLWEFFQAGVNSWSAHRRTIPEIPLGHEDPLDWANRQKGCPHEGSDLFVTTPEIARTIVPEMGAFGMPGIGNLIMLYLATADESFLRIENGRFSFHLGDERTWLVDERSQFDELNTMYLFKAAQELRDGLSLFELIRALRRAGLQKFAKRKLGLHFCDWSRKIFR